VKVYGLLGRGMNVAFRVCVRRELCTERRGLEVVDDGRRGEDERRLVGAGSFPILAVIFLVFY
jgi:hypothetical protein